MITIRKTHNHINNTVILKTDSYSYFRAISGLFQGYFRAISGKGYNRKGLFQGYFRAISGLFQGYFRHDIYTQGKIKIYYVTIKYCNVSNCHKLVTKSKKVIQLFLSRETTS